MLLTGPAAAGPREAARYPRRTVKYLSFLLTGIALCAPSSSCAPTLDVPPAPDVRPVLFAYENPTAVVGSAIMAAVADEIAEIAAEVENSEFFEELMRVIIEVQKEIDDATDANGNLELGGVLFPSPNGAVQITFVCEGWDETQSGFDRANGAMELNMTLAGGTIGPVVWGEIDACQYPVEIGLDRFDASYDGDVAVYLGELVSPGQDLYELPITFITSGTIGFDGDDFRLKQSFRVVFRVEEPSGDVGIARLEILVQVNDTETFVYFLETDSLAQGIRDATGAFGCSLEERQCFNESGPLFSW